MFLSDALIAKLKKNFEKSACQNESEAYNSRPATESFERGFGGSKISQQLVDEVFRAVLTMLTFSKRVSKKKLAEMNQKRIIRGLLSHEG